VRVRPAALALAGALVLGACRTPVPPAPPLPPDDRRPEQWLARWEACAEGRQALRGRARIAVDVEGSRFGGGEVHLRSRQRIVLARPARLRVEVQALFGATVAVLATDGQRYELFEVGDRSYASGPVHDGLLWEVARIGLTPAEAVDVILGSPRATEQLSVAGAWALPEGGVRVALADAEGAVRRQLEFDAEGRLRRLRVDPADGEAWEVRYDDYALVDGEPLAERVSLDLRGGRSKAVLSLSDVEINPQLPPDVFRLRAPAAPEGGGARGPTAESAS
jgi:hypothetical protein